MKLTIDIVKREEAKQYIEDLALFRIKYFREFPYLYEGQLEYEREYAAAYTTDKEAILVVAKDGDRVIAISTALPLLSEAQIVKSAVADFKNAGLKPEELFYFGEMIVEENYQGQGIGSRIFAVQEEYARDLGYKGACFLVVQRDKEHPLRPQNYRGNDSMFIKRGYQKTNITTTFSWPTIQDTGETIEMENTMVYWIKAW